MTRLKYYDTAPGLIYTDWFTLGPNLIVRGIINLETFSYQVYEFDSQMMSSGQATNLREAKSKLKKLLISCGVNFDGEIRKRI